MNLTPLILIALVAMIILHEFFIRKMHKAYIADQMPTNRFYNRLAIITLVLGFLLAIAFVISIVDTCASSILPNLN